MDEVGRSAIPFAHAHLEFLDVTVHDGARIIDGDVQVEQVLAPALDGRSQSGVM